MAMRTSAEDAQLLFNGWLSERVQLKALFFSPDLRCCATVYGLLHAGPDADWFVYPSEVVDPSLETSALVFRLEDVKRYEFAAADVVESSAGLQPGELAKPHGETMLTVVYENGASLSLSNLASG